MKSKKIRCKHCGRMVGVTVVKRPDGTKVYKMAKHRHRKGVKSHRTIHGKLKGGSVLCGGSNAIIPIEEAVYA